ncbi:MAG: hypothetical protein KDM91_01785, partial [Verrucomicrobiae bacterium]|nr:hypothetical protein [Verrucomicrobiae bacterium]
APEPAPEPEPEPEPFDDLAPPPPHSDAKPRVLVVHPVASTGRLVREALENFTHAEVDTSPDAIHGFELALRRHYRLFVFALFPPDLDGVLLYELLCKAHPRTHRASPTAPGVVFVRETGDPPPAADLARDARVKAILTKPLSIEKLLQSVDGTLKRRDPIEETLKPRPEAPDPVDSST